jgi:hypothetical protein
MNKFFFIFIDDFRPFFKNITFYSKLSISEIAAKIFGILSSKAAEKKRKSSPDYCLSFGAPNFKETTKSLNISFKIDKTG